MEVRKSLSKAVWLAGLPNAENIKIWRGRVFLADKRKEKLVSMHKGPGMLETMMQK